MSESKNRDDGESNKVSIAISASRSPITQAGSISPVIAPPATRMFPPHRSPWSNAGGGCAGSSVPTESASDSTRRPSAGGRYGRWQRNRRSAQKLAQSLLRALTIATEPKRAEEHTSELQSLMRSSYAVF